MEKIQRRKLIQYQPPKPPPSKVYAYTRVSTQRQVDNGVSIEAQTEYINAYCRVNNLPLPIHYCDQAYSGTNDNRPAFIAMMDDISEGDIIICYSMSRLSRSTQNFLKFTQTIRDKKIRLICLFEHIDLRNDDQRPDPMTNFMLTILSALCQMESDITRRRTSDAMQHLKATGKLRSKPRFGFHYEISPNGEKHLVETPQEQQIIKFVCQQRDKEPFVSMMEIARRVQFAVGKGELPLTKANIYPVVKSIIDNNNLDLDYPRRVGHYSSKHSTVVEKQTTMDVKAEAPVKTEEVKAEPVKTEEVKVEPVKVEEVKAEAPAKVEEVKAEAPAKVEEVKPETPPIKIPTPLPFATSSNPDEDDDDFDDEDFDDDEDIDDEDFDDEDIDFDDYDDEDIDEYLAARLRHVPKTPQHSYNLHRSAIKPSPRPKLLPKLYARK